VNGKPRGTLPVSNTVGISIILVFVILGAGLISAILVGYPNHAPTTSVSSTSSTEKIDGVVVGYVTVGPSKPVCQPTESCTVNLSGYSLDFSTLCPQGTVSVCEAQNYSATISPSGHYTALLPAGSYLITGLSPSCNWAGCSSAFPEIINVEGGMQLVVNINIDTGIR
jgi:hypothetical protein